MKPEELRSFLDAQRWSQARLAREFGLSPNKVGRMLSGRAKIEPVVAFACAAVAFKLPKWGAPAR